MCYIQCHVHLQIVCEWVSLLTAVIIQNAIVVENAASISIEISSTHLSKKLLVTMDPRLEIECYAVAYFNRVSQFKVLYI